MKRNLKMLGVSVLAVLAFGALSAASASASHQPIAEPQEGGFPVPFTGTGKGGTLETVNERVVTCTGSSASGNLTGQFESEASLKFTGCKSGFATCTTAGQASGTILSSVKGKSVYTPANSAAVLFTPAEAGEPFAGFSCTFLGVGSKVTVTGSVVCPITPPNKSTKEFSLACSQTEGIQEPTEYLNEKCKGTVATLSSKGEKINGGPEWAAEQAGIDGSQTLTLERNVVITDTECKEH